VDFAFAAVGQDDHGRGARGLGQNATAGFPKRPGDQARHRRFTARSGHRDADRESAQAAVDDKAFEQEKAEDQPEKCGDEDQETDGDPILSAYFHIRLGSSGRLLDAKADDFLYLEER
jgi:hypothetical protein